MGDSKWPHPRFDSPPVIETAFSFQFSPLPDWKIPHFGLYWETIRDRYPKLDVHSAIPSQIEEMEEPPAPKSLRVGFTSTPPVRCWFYNDPESLLIQVQNDRFVFNWKRGLSGEPYPHYDAIRPVIVDEWDRFVSFVNENRLGSVHIQKCEVTYINHIEKGVGWKDYGQLGDVLPVWAGRINADHLPAPEDVEINVRYLIPDRRGRLYVHAQPAIRNADMKEIIQLTLTARGRPQTSERAGILDWLDFGQEFVARSFLAFTSERMHALWGLRSTP